MPKPTIFTVNIAETPRLLFSIQERASGDLTIIVKHSKFSAPYEDATIEEGQETGEERYSVHLSPQSEGTNTIKYSRLGRGGETEYSYNNTTAIKKDGRIAGVFIRRVSDLSNRRYVVEPYRGTILSLGDYDPAQFQPVFAVFVSDPNRAFTPAKNVSVNYTQLKLGAFNVIVLWQFILLTGFETSASLHITTKPDNFDPDDPIQKQTLDRMIRGFDEEGVLRCFQDLKLRLINSWLDVVWDRLSPEEKIQHDALHRALRLVEIGAKQGTTSTEEYVTLLKRVFRYKLWFMTSGAPTSQSLE
jgi:hypothetical protein